MFQQRHPDLLVGLIAGLGQINSRLTPAFRPLTNHQTVIPLKNQHVARKLAHALATIAWETQVLAGLVRVHGDNQIGTTAAGVIGRLEKEGEC